MSRQGLRGALATSSVLALVIGMQGAADAAPPPVACHFNNVAGGVDNTTAQDCVAYNGGGAFTGNVTNESTGSLTTTPVEGGPLPGTASGISVLTPLTTLNGNIVNKGTITSSYVDINIGTGNFGTPPTSPGAGATLNGSITNSGSLLFNAGATGTSAISLNGTGSVVTGSITNDMNGTITGAGVGIAVTNSAHLGGSILNDGTMNIALGHGFEINTGATIAGDVTNSATGKIITTGSAGMSIAGNSSIAGTVTNAGTITSTRYGILLAPTSIGGSVINSGIMNSGGYGIVLFGSSNSLTSHVTGNVSNTGTINANGRDGIAVFAFSSVDGAITNTNQITAARNGIVVVNTTNVAGAAKVTGGISNSGTITNTGTGFAGIALVGGTVSNGITNTSAGAINNALGAGILVSNQTPIRLAGFASTLTGGITNQGSIAARTGIVVGGGSTVGTITNSGNITGSGGTAIDLATVNGGAGAATTVNQQGGTITGAILLSALADTVNISGGAISGNIVGQGSSNTVNFALGAGGGFSYSNAITGVNAVNVNSGTLMLGGTIGPTNLTIGNAGTLVVQANGSIAGNVTDNGILAVSRTDTFTFGNVISGSGAFQQVGTGTTVLTNTNGYTGNTTITAGTLQLGNGGTTGSIVGNVLDNGVLAIDRSNAVSFSGVISGSGAFSQIGTGTTTLTGASNYTGPTTVSAGTLTISATGSITSNVTNSATFNNAGTVTGTLINTGSASNSGTISNGLTNTAGTTTNSGTINGFATVTGGTLTNNNLVVGTVGIIGTGTVTNNLTITGAVNNAATFNNNASGTVSGLLTNSAGTTTNAGQLNSGASVSGGTLTNNNLVVGTVGITGTGTVTNNLTITGAVNNAATFSNNANGTVSGLLTNTAGTTTNAGQLNGGATVVGGTLTNNNRVVGTVGITGPGTVTNNLTITGAVNNDGTFNNNVNGTVSGLLTDIAGTTTNNGQLNGGAIVSGNGTLANNLTITGAVNNTGAFNNNANGTVSGLLTNVGGVTTNSGQLNSGANVTGGTLVNNLTITGAVNNAGTFVNNANGTVSGLLTSTAGITTNNGQLNSGANVTGGTLANNLTITGAVNNAGTFNNNANGTVSGLLTNTAGATNNAGQLNSGASVSGGTLTNNNLIVGTLGITGTGTVTNNLTITGAVNNAATFNNNASGTVSGLLTNSAGTTTNAGQLNNGARISGGTLNTNTPTSIINGGLTNTATVNAAGTVNGAIANNAGTFNVVGNLASNGTFANAAGATLAVGAATYTLQGLLTNSGAVTVVNGGQLIATVGGVTNNAGGSITVAVGGTVKDDLNNAGIATNNGAYFANVATNTGTITNGGTWTGNVASNTGTITNNLTWIGTVSNAGTFTNSAGATVSGLLTSSAGAVSNNGSLAGGAVISGTLTGAGSVANLTIGNGGTFAPGGGTAGTSMTVSGNLAFQSGALYMVQLNPTTASLASVAGSAALNGTAAAVYAAGNYVSKTYTILTAAGGVTGTFGSLANTNLPANFHTSLSYDANDVFLNLALNFVPPTTPNFGGPLNVNQQNVANTLVNFFNATGGIPMVFGTLTPGGLTQASGEAATGSQQTTFDAMNLFLGLLTDPFVAGRGDRVSSAGGATPFAEDEGASAYADSGKARSKSERDAYAAIYRKAPLAAPFVPSWSVWAAGYGGSQTTNGNAVLGSNTATSQVYGTAVGADYRFSPFTTAGFALAGGGTNFSIANALGSGRSDLFQAGAFVRHTVGQAYISGALAYGWQDITTNRTVTVAGIDQLRAEFNANAYSGRVEGGYRFMTPWMGVTPYAAGQFTTFDLPAYAEQAIVGANTFALAYNSRSVTDSRSELGLRTDKSWAMTDSIFTLRGRFAWAHDFDPDRNIAATFQTLPGASFVVNGAAQAHDSALTTASAEVKWMNGWSAAATFEGEFSSVTSSYAGKGVVRYTW